MNRAMTLALCLLAGPVMAQDLMVLSPGDLVNHFPKPVLARLHAATGDADLDRAVAICDAHITASGTIYPTIPPSLVPAWEGGYEACVAVMDQWSKTSAARAQAAAAEQEKQDRAFLEQFVKK